MSLTFNLPEKMIAGLIEKISQAINNLEKYHVDNFRWILSGFHYGYSAESCGYFMARCQLVDLEISGLVGVSTCEGTPFAGTGFVPCPRESRRPFMEVVNEINNRRRCIARFPLIDEGEIPFPTSEWAEDFSKYVVSVKYYTEEALKSLLKVQ